MGDKRNIEKNIHRIDGQLYETIIVKDDQGNQVQSFDIPLKVELKIQDLIEIIVGASILAVPVAFTEEVWNMGEDLAWFNIILLNIVGILFLASFIYFKSYRMHLTLYRMEFYKRVLTTFLLSLIIVGLLLTIVDKCPWFTDFDIASKRVLIGAFPAAMSATVTDNF